MKKTIFGALLLTVITLFFACKKQPLETPQATICMKRDLTQCSDPWGSYNPSMGSAQAFFNTYFTNNNLQATFSNLTLSDSTFITCFGCFCPSGEMLYVQAESQSVQALTNLGFVPCQAEATVCMKRMLTQCAETWMPDHTAALPLSELFAEYCTTNNINATFTNITVDSSLIQVCAACTCLSGKIMYVEAAPEAVAALQNVGFVTCNSSGNNSLVGEWVYKSASGGITGAMIDLTPENRRVSFSATEATFTQGTNMPYVLPYFVVEKNPSFPGEYGITYESGTPSTNNFWIRNDSLFLSDLMYDGYVTTLVRH